MSELLSPALPVGAPGAPVRMCVGCRQRSVRSELLRVVVVPATEGASGRWVAQVDPRAERPGRGAWIHPRIDCFELADKRRAWMRAFRLATAPDSSAIRHHLEAEHDNSTDELVGAGAAGLPEKAGREAMSAR